MAFMSGYIAIVGGDVGELEDYHNTRVEGDFELSAHVNFSKDILDLEGDTIARYGRAAEQVLEESDVPDVDEEGSIKVQQSRSPQWKFTEFWLVQSGDEQDFLVVRNSEGVFAMDLLSEVTGVAFQQVRFDLESIASDFPGQWVGGFEKREGRVQSGMLYGDEIEEDVEMGDPFKRTSNKNVIGPKIEYRGTKLSVKVGLNGWVQIVSPGTYPREAYLCFVRDVLLNYAY